MLLMSYCECLNHSESHIDGWVHCSQMKFQCAHAARLDDFMDYFLTLWVKLCAHVTCFPKEKRKKKYFF